MTFQPYYTDMSLVCHNFFRNINTTTTADINISTLCNIPLEPKYVLRNIVQYPNLNENCTIGEKIGEYCYDTQIPNNYELYENNKYYWKHKTGNGIIKLNRGLAAVNNRFCPLNSSRITNMYNICLTNCPNSSEYIIDESDTVCKPI